MTTVLKDHAQDPRDFEARVSTLEAASDTHAVKIRDHGGLLVSMDEDISKIQVEFRAQRGLLQALHDTQNEHIAELREHRAILSEHTAILSEHTAILSDHSAQLAEIRVGVQTIIDLLTPEPGSEN
jgi:hypothetical protein